MPEPCTICQKPCISMCPYCKKYVCGGYGYLGATCGLRHEAVCPPAAEARSQHKQKKEEK